MLLTAILMPSAPAIVSLSGETITTVDASSPYDSYSGIRVNIGGTIQERTNGGGFSTIDFATDWILPRNKIGIKTYHFKYDYIGATLNVGSDSTGAWIELVTSLNWYITSTVFEIISGTGTLSVSDDGGTTTLASASFDPGITNF